MLSQPISPTRQSIWPQALFTPVVLVLISGASVAMAAEPEPEKPQPGQAPATADSLRLPPAAFDKLSADQIVSLDKAREITRRGRSSIEPDVASLVVPIGFFLMLFGIIFAVQRNRSQRDKHKQETLRAMVEKGAQIPPELLNPPQPRGSDLRRGAVWLGIGIGVMGFFGALSVPEPGPTGLWALGLVPALIGVAYLVAWRFETSRQAKGG